MECMCAQTRPQVILSSKEKSPLPEKFSSEEDGTHDAASRRTASSTHYQLSHSGPLITTITMITAAPAMMSCTKTKHRHHHHNNDIDVSDNDNYNRHDNSSSSSPTTTTSSSGGGGGSCISGVGGVGMVLVVEVVPATAAVAPTTSFSLEDLVLSYLTMSLSN